jgi:uncharacterized protein DUF5916/cellulose/xylan binding protein with CBM9 domain
LKHFIFLLLAAYALFGTTAISGDNPRSVRAVRVTTPPRIDGMLDDEVWKLAEPASGFIQRDPEEGKPASERSEIRILYDDEALYFSCIFYDAEPDKIVARLTRRDNEIESDEASIRIDSYHDHQTGSEFTFNAAGVKIDKLQYDDADREDDSWDPVWYLQTRITDQGWCAEIKIPFRILRYRTGLPDTAENIWGLNLLRYISRKQEEERWAFTPKSQSGFISRYGHLTGLRGLPDPRQIEVLPFVTGKQSYDPATGNRDRREQASGDAGLDLKYGLSSNLTIDATFNPDFGQVEADPAVLNLSTFETFYPEKRPFFIEGTQILHFTTFGDQSGPGLFYSRRIGRGISGGEVAVPDGGKIDDLPQQATILGAAKLTGKTNGGLSLGFLQAVTAEENAVVIDPLGHRSEQLLEPLADYTVLRLKQDILTNSNVGLIVTSAAKNGRPPSFTNGYDWNLRFVQNTYQLNGFIAFSQSTSPDNLRITGEAGKINYAKIGGEHWLWSLSTDFTSNHYNINDVGFFFSPDDIGSIGEVTYKEDVPGKIVRSYDIGFFYHQRHIFEGANIAREIHLSTDLLFSNYWGMSASGDANFGLYDHRETRGNGLYRKPVNYATNISMYSDSRSNVVLTLGQNFGWDEKFRRENGTSIGVSIRTPSWMEWNLSTGVDHVNRLEAWVDTIRVSGAVRSIFADRSTDQVNCTIRSTITFTKELTLQLYGQLFLAKGHYETFRQLVGTSDFQPPDHYGRNPDFNTQSFNTNVVLRWEYLPGSTLFLVWSQARSGAGGEYSSTFANNVDATFVIPPSNVVLLKLSYWFSL